MAQEQLSPEGVMQCKGEGQMTQYKKHKEKIAKLVEAGVLEMMPCGRPRLYTPEEAFKVAKRQRQESYLRRKSRLDAAKALLVQVVPEEA